MTQQEFQDIWPNVHEAIVDVIKANVPAGTTKVIGRDTFSDNEADWAGRITAADGSIHCWSVFYTGTANLEDSDVPTATEIFVPTFRLVGYHYYNFGTDADNSSRKFQDELNKLRWAFMQNQSLGLPDHVRSHTGFIDQTVLGQINLKPVHIARVDMGVVLHPVPYEYDNS